LETIAYDRWGMAHLQRELDGAGVTASLSEFGQGFKGFSPAVDTLERCIAQGLLRHGGDPILTMCALNAVVVRDPSGNRKLDKSRSAGKIDGLVALAMALQAAQEFEAVVLPSCIARHL
jgi:phage terminase large subunit-like protein